MVTSCRQSFALPHKQDGIAGVLPAFSDRYKLKERKKLNIESFLLKRCTVKASGQFDRMVNTNLTNYF